MADVAFNSSDHKLTESDVPQGKEGLQKSSQAVGNLAKGQAPQDWTPEPAAQLLRDAVVHFFSACDEAFRQEKKLWTSSARTSISPSQNSLASTNPQAMN